MSLPSKLSRAIAGYLVSAGVGTNASTLPLFSNKARPYPNVTVIPARGNPEPATCGNYRFQINISVKGSNAKDPNSTNQEAGRVAFDALVKQAQESLMLSDDQQTLRATYRLINNAAHALAVAVDETPDAVQFAANNADMVDFTIIEWSDLGFALGTADEEGCSWEQVLIFDCICCASLIPGYT